MNGLRTFPRKLGPAVLLSLLALFAASSAAFPQVQCSRTVEAHVVALDQVLELNRMGAQMPGGMIFALAGDVFPAGTPVAQQTYANSCRMKPDQCKAGQVVLRDAKRPRPLVLRVNERECLKITFTNLLASQCGNGPCAGVCSNSPGTGCSSDSGCTGGGTCQPQPPTRTASIHVQGMPWAQSSADDGAFVGKNADSNVAPGQTKSYNLYAEREGSYLLYSMSDAYTNLNSLSGGDGGQLTQGLFGAVNVQPSGYEFNENSYYSEFYRSQVTEQDLCAASADAAFKDGVCYRKSPAALPTLNYQALYPAGHPRQFLPVLNMQCSQRLTPDSIAKGLCTDGELVSSDLTAVITGPSNKETKQPGAFPNEPVDLRPPSLRPVYAYPDRRQPYREFTIIYHESFQVTQAFQNQFNALPSFTAAQDNFGFNYGMGALSPSVLSNRLEVGPAANCTDCKFEEFFLSSWALGDPAMVVTNPPTNCVDSAGKVTRPCDPGHARFPDDPSNVYHSYMSDHVKFRILHAGPDLHHLHHQHAHQWLATPNSPNGDYLDSQSLGPGSSFTLEMVYNGSGNVNQTVGDSIFHCHFYPHFASGMWSLWRVHDVFEEGTLADPGGKVIPGRKNPNTGLMEYSRALPDGDIADGSPTPALVPMATLPMAPMPAPIRLQGVCRSEPDRNCFEGDACGCEKIGSRFCVVQRNLSTGKEECLSPYESTPKGWEVVSKGGYKSPGFPFFVPGVGGTRAPHPPLDFAWACSGSGKICTPYNQGSKEHKLLARFAEPLPDDGICGPTEGVCEPMDGGLPRNVAVQGERADWTGPTNSNIDISKVIEKMSAIKLPEEGTLVEKIAMAAHATRFHDTKLPDGRTNGVCSDNKAPCTATDLSECLNPLKATCTQERINFVLNGLPPVQGAPYADPCINFDRRGGTPPDILTRAYLAADIQLDAIFNKAGWHFPQQRMIALWGDVRDFVSRAKPPEPLFLRVNSYDCMSYVLANLVPNVYELDDFQIRTPTDILGQHIHLVKFDVTSSDGAGNGWNYEDGTFAPNEVTERIRAINKGGLFVPGSKDGKDPSELKPKTIKFFGPGPGAQPGEPGTGAWQGAQATVQRWYDDPLLNNFGYCSTDLDKVCNLGQNEAIKLAGLPLGEACPNKGLCVASAGFCSDTYERCTESDHSRCGKEANCLPLQDRTIRTVFTHDHFGPSTHQQAGLYAGVVAEPKGSVWRDNETGEIMGGYDRVTGENFPGREVKQNGVKVFDGGPTSWQAVIETSDRDMAESFREFMLQVQDSTLTYKAFAVAGNPFEQNRQGVCAGVNDEPCGFCSYTGRCSNDRTKICQIQINNFGVSQDVTRCGDTGATCLYGTTKDPNDPNLVACTPTDVSACFNDPKSANPSSCNFVAGIPSASWKAGGPIGSEVATKGVEAITFNGATNNFSVNYRNEPLYTRTTAAATGNVLAGAMGDLGYVFSSTRFCQKSPDKLCRTDTDCGSSDLCVSRPNPRGNVCSNNLAVSCVSVSDCPKDSAGNPGSCQPAGFCSDNYNLCVAANTSLCGVLGASCQADPWSSPYSPLTPGVHQEDPFTPLLRAYANDDVQIRTLIGAHINPHNFTLHGMNWLKEGSYVDSGWRNSEVEGISEHFESIVKVPPVFTAPAGSSTRDPWTDLIYNPGLAAIEQAGGNWGLMRAYSAAQRDLYPLPQNQNRNEPVSVCPPGARSREYQVVAMTAMQALGGSLVYNRKQGIVDPQGLLMFNGADPGLRCATPGNWSTCTYSGEPQPLVLRASAGECVKVTLYNALPNATSDLLCSVQGQPSCQDKRVGDSCGQNSQGVCGLYSGGKGACSTNPGQVCTLSDYTLKCPPVLCNNGVCSNSGVTCTSPVDCPILQCTAPVGVGVPSLQLVNLGSANQSAQSLTSVQVGLKPQLVAYDGLSSDGTNAGFNPVQTAAPGGQTVYTWYAGNIDPDAKDPAKRYIPIEFGAANLLPADPLNHYLHGLFGGLIIEPEGATWEPKWGGGAEALVSYRENPQAGGRERRFHEFVVFAQDDSNNLNFYSAAASTAQQLSTVKINAVNYKSENLIGVQRYCDSSCSGQSVSCMLAEASFCKDASGTCAPCNFKPETPTFVARAGEEVRFRLLHGGGTNTNNTFEIFGHNFSEAPYMTLKENCVPPIMHTSLVASQILGTKNLCGSQEFFFGKRTGGLWQASLNEWRGARMGHGPGNHFDVLIDSAGGPGKVCGDYLYRSYPADHFNQGLWGMLRVVDPSNTADPKCNPPASANASVAPSAAPAGR
jgi:hypothetical protein